MRATETDVKGVIDTALTEEQLTPFLRQASVVLDGCVAAGGGTYDVAALKETEILLAAWFLCSRDPRVKDETTDDAKSSFDLQSYWDRAVLMDPTGELAEWRKPGVDVRINVF